MANLYKVAGDTQTAIIYFKKSADFAKANKLEGYYSYESVMERLCVMTGRYDSALYYLGQYIHAIKTADTDTTVQKANLAEAFLSLREIYLIQKKYKEALSNFFEPLNFYTEGNNRIKTMKTLLDIAIVFEAQNNNNQVLFYSRQLTEYADSVGARQYLRDDVARI